MVLGRWLKCCAGVLKPLCALFWKTVLTLSVNGRSKFKQVASVTATSVKTAKAKTGRQSRPELYSTMTTLHLKKKRERK